MVVVLRGRVSDLRAQGQNTRLAHLGYLGLGINFDQRKRGKGGKCGAEKEKAKSVQY